MAPNQPKTPVLAVRIAEATQERLRDEAARTGVTVSDVIRAAIDAYLDRPRRE